MPTSGPKRTTLIPSHFKRSTSHPEPHIINEPFKRIIGVDLSLSRRQNVTKDPRLLVMRAGYPKHPRKDYKFWKSTKEDIPVQAPSYSEWKFCKGFNITAMDFYIIRRRLMSLLYRNQLYNKRRKVDRQIDFEVDFEYAEVKEKISKHHLLQSRQAHAYWKGKMIAEFITKTAALIREKKMFI
ncbi:hypothetical protein HBI09_018580 [Parastagonospora nodorum]|nr:hypothetical protein HBI09_018580 [Parastagonospora nodorum]